MQIQQLDNLVSWLTYVWCMTYNLKIVNKTTYYKGSWIINWDWAKIDEVTACNQDPGEHKDSYVIPVARTKVSPGHSYNIRICTLSMILMSHFCSKALVFLSKSWRAFFMFGRSFLVYDMASSSRNSFTWDTVSLCTHTHIRMYDRYHKLAHNPEPV